MKKRFARGFTLTELIVAVGILAVLSAIAIPMVNAGIRSSHKAGCLSNLRQIGVGLEAYIQDNQNRFPVLEAGRSSRDEDIPVLETELADYVGDSEIFRCPADREEFENTGSSYLWNVTQNGARRVRLEFMGEPQPPSRIPLVADKEAWHPGEDSGTNFLYADYSASNRVTFGISQ